MINVEKPKNDSSVLETFELASIGSRLFALIIDNILIGIISGIVGGVSGSDGGVIGFITYFLLLSGYQWYFLLYRNGQTPGKSAMHIRVIKTDGTPMSGSDAVLRALGYVINNALLGLGWLWALFDSSYQGIQDKLANTYVVKA
ncbi:MAG: RDD family protein [Chloroflexi bacterium]|nr:RDD family protein [Chloroflexota bacterium]